MTRGEKRKFEDWKPVATAKQVYKQYTAKDMADYKAMKAGERKVKKEGAVAPMREVNHRVWEEARKSVNQKVVDKEKKDTKCTPYGRNNHTWKFVKSWYQYRLYAEG